MSTMEAKDIHEIRKQIEMLNLTIQGDKSIGIDGLVVMLNNIADSLEKHRQESKNNFSEFKTTIVTDNLKNYKHFDERLRPLEKSHKEQAKNLGIVGGLGLVLGFLASYLKDFFNIFSE